MIQIAMCIRLAKAEDFKNSFGQKKIGAIYFEKSAFGTIHPQPRYLDDQTNLSQFKILFDSQQIFVPAPYSDNPQIRNKEIDLQQ